MSSDHEIVLADLVNEYTGDWVKEISCDQIKSKTSFLDAKVVYFGPLEDIALGKYAEMLLQASISDRFKFVE